MSYQHKHAAAVRGLALTVATCGLLGFAQPAYAGTGVFLGKSLTASSSTYFGSTCDRTQSHCDSSFSYHKPEGEAFGYYLLENTGGDGVNLGSCGVNDKGVIISSAADNPIQEDISQVDPLVEGGVSQENVAAKILPRAKDAREALDLLAKEVSAKGLGKDRIWQCWIGDKYGAWLFSALSGHQWVAFKCPDTGISINPDMMNLNYNLHLLPNVPKEENVEYSKGLVSVAKKAGRARYFQDGSFNVFASYGPEPSEEAFQRLVAGISMVAPAQAQSYEQAGKNDASLFFTPPNLKKPVSTYTLLKSFSKDASQTASECHIFQVRDTSTTAGLDIVQWEGFGSQELRLFVPYYPQLVQTVPVPLQKGGKDNLAREMSRMVELADQVQAKSSKDNLVYLRENMDQVQKDLINDQVKINHAMDSVKKSKDVQKLAGPLAEASFGAALSHVQDINHQLQAYLDAEDFSKPFKPNNAQDLKYAEQFVDSHNFIADKSIDSVRVGLTEQTQDDKDNAVAILATAGVMVAVAFGINYTQNKKKQA